jgi:threonine synthase
MVKNKGAIAAGEPMNVRSPLPATSGTSWLPTSLSKWALPIQKLIIASNENKVLVDFFDTGAYDRNRDFILTTSPSMDILVLQQTWSVCCT